MRLRIKRFKPAVSIVAVIVTIMASSLICSCSTRLTVSDNEAAQSAASSKRTVIRIGLASDSDEPGGANSLAARKGFLEEELGPLGYDVEYFGFAAAGPAVNEALIAGDLDLALYGNLPPILLKSNGIDVSVLSFYTERLHYVVITHEDSDIRSVKDLEGKRVLVGRGTVVQEYWFDLVKTYGIDESKVEVINEVVNAQSVFLSGAADALISTEVVEEYLKPKAPIRVIENTRLSHPELASQGVLVGRGKFIAEHREAVVAYIRAFLRGYDYAFEHVDEVPELFATAATPKEIIKSFLDRYPDDYLEKERGAITPAATARLDRVNEYLYANGFSQRDVDMDELIDASFYEEAVASL
ncbi:MAG: ABC transporter substrate-binding protein [Clostridiales bacterium]|nr:ABC transporter substrate-binding protein [Clostridiales bacterium]